MPTTQIADRVVETTTTTGTGTYTLDGARTGYRSFADAVTAGDFATGDTVYYYATDGTDWEVGSGVFTVATLTLTRATIARSSNAGAAVNWGAGSKDVVCNMPAAELQKLIDNSFGPTTITAGTLTTNVKVLDLSATWNNAGVTFTGKLNAFTDTASNVSSLLENWTVGGVSKCYIRKDGLIVAGGILANNQLSIANTYGAIGANSAGTEYYWGLNSTRCTISASMSLSWHSSATNILVGSVDLQLFRDAANTLAQRNGTNAQTFRSYRTYTDASNYQRLTHTWNTSTAVIHNEGAGTGADGNIAFNDAALATTATKGYVMIPSCAGAPTGVPADIPTGQVALHYDSTNNKLYVYNGAWVSTAALT